MGTASKVVVYALYGILGTVLSTIVYWPMTENVWIEEYMAGFPVAWLYFLHGGPLGPCTVPSFLVGGLCITRLGEHVMLPLNGMVDVFFWGAFVYLAAKLVHQRGKDLIQRLTFAT